MDFSHQQGHNYVRRVSTAVLAEAPLPHMAAVHHFGGGAQFEVQAGSWGIEVAGARGIGVGRVGIGETGAVWAEGIEAVWADTEGAGGGLGLGGLGLGGLVLQLSLCRPRPPTRTGHLRLCLQPWCPLCRHQGPRQPLPSLWCHSPIRCIEVAGLGGREAW